MGEEGNKSGRLTDVYEKRGRLGESGGWGERRLRRRKAVEHKRSAHQPANSLEDGEDDGNASRKFIFENDASHRRGGGKICGPGWRRDVASAEGQKGREAAKKGMEGEKREK
ncbi:hypothetical protein KM043_015501 [Ampulex compressa]|nr:hypothetical protein KM043_015501 [Ampulex compressa]